MSNTCSILKTVFNMFINVDLRYTGEILENIVGGSVDFVEDATDENINSNTDQLWHKVSNIRHDADADLSENKHKTIEKWSKENVVKQFMHWEFFKYILLF